MNPSSSTELEVRSDIIRDFDTKSEHEQRMMQEEQMRQKAKPAPSMVKQVDYQAAFDLLSGPKQAQYFQKRSRSVNQISGA